jgi:2-succinyl-6-hydroxy-2,4-cyclohexadiene-1-carboxylate synthase
MRILALHGFTGAGDDFAPLRALLPQEWVFHCPDLPGHGAHANAPLAGCFSLAQHLDFISQQVQALPGTKADPLVLIGYSMGGRLALHWAMQSPNAASALILISASPGIHDEAQRLQRRHADAQLADSLRHDGIGRFMRNWWQKPLFEGFSRNLSAAARDALHARRLGNSPAGLAASLDSVGTGALPSLWEKLPTFPLPTLCVVGEMDTRFVAIAQKMSAALPAGKMRLISSAWHCPHLEKPRLVADQLRSWLLSAQAPPRGSRCVC